MTELTVSDMTCQHCKASIEKAVAALDPQAVVTVDLDTKAVSIASALEAAQLVAAIEQAGFEPVLRG